MMTNQHPITPPPELVHQWHKEACKDPYNGSTFFMSKTLHYICASAAQWGAEQELEACCEWVGAVDGKYGPRLRLARRPQPTLKEQALALIDDCTDPEGDYLDDNALSIIRQALEQLDD